LAKFIDAQCVDNIDGFCNAAEQVKVISYDKRRSCACGHGVRVMTFLLPLTAIAGAVLGLRFKISVLAPAILLLGAITLAVGVANGPNVRRLMLGLAALVFLQIGYVIGCILRSHLILKRKETSHHPLWSPTHFL
jgi:hypothetical protein